MGWEKVACWSTKATIFLKCVKIQEKILWRAHRKSQTLFRTAPSSTPYGLPFPKIGGSQPHTKTAIAIISRMAKATDCKFGRYIHRVHPNKSRLKIWEKRERGRIQGLPKFFHYTLLSQERVLLFLLFSVFVVLWAHV